MLSLLKNVQPEMLWIAKTGWKVKELHEKPEPSLAQQLAETSEMYFSDWTEIRGLLEVTAQTRLKLWWEVARIVTLQFH